MGFSLSKMFTPPKSKSPWEAMTAGSTGGWAKGIEPWGPAITTALGAVPGVGPFLSTGAGLISMAGKGTGFQGTDKGWGNLGSTLWGGLQGYGLGSIGSGIGSGLQSMAGGMPVGASSTFTAGQTGANAGTWGKGLLGNFGSGFGQGVANYTAPLVQGLSGVGKSLGIGGMPSGAASTFTPGQVGANAGTYGANPYTWQNILGSTGLSNKELLGAGLLGVSALQQPPRLGQSEQDRTRAREAIYAPNLVEARNMIRGMALSNPSELVNPASDQYIQATLRQSRQALDRSKQEVINTYSARGKVVGKSGAVDERLARMDQEQLQNETDFIGKTNESRYLAGIQLKVQAVQQYFNVSSDEALQLLNSYGYINDIDKTNYMAELQAFNNLQQVQGLIGSSLYMSGNRTNLF